MEPKGRGKATSHVGTAGGGDRAETVAKDDEAAEQVAKHEAVEK